MDQTQQWNMMRNALSSIGFDPATVSSFDEDTLDKLCAAKFHLPGRIQSATREDLKEANLAAGDASIIISKVQGVAARDSAAAAGAVAACASVSRFWARLSAATVKDDFLELADGCFFLGDELKGGAILLRKCYKDLTDIIMDLVGRNVRKIAILGSPGIGKSFFLLYLMYHLVNTKSSPPVVVLNICNKYVICFNHSSVTEGTLADFKEHLDSRDTWYLVDGVRPAIRTATTILVSSPTHDTYYQFLKELGATCRYMPVWDKDEVDTCRSKLFPTLSQDLVDHLFGRWGGRVRYVLEKALDRSAQALLGNATSTSDLMQVLNSLGCNGSEDKASDRLLSIEVNKENYTDITMVFASPYISEIVTGRLMQTKQVEVRLWLASTEIGAPMADALRGVLFERLAHIRLKDGGDFEYRKLHSGRSKAPPPETKVENFRFNGVLRFSNLAEVSNAADGTYCYPVASNLGAVDALVQPNMLFQMTVANKHSINVDKYKEAVRVLKCKAEEVHLYFVVPTNLYDTFLEQQLKRKASDMSPSAPVVQQYVIKVELAPSRTC